MKKTFKVLLFMMMLTFSVAFVSCDKDDEPANVIDDWYSECTNVQGGGLTPQKCSQLKDMLNTDEDLQLGPGFVWRNMETSQAIYYFNSQMRLLQSVFSEGMSGISGNLDITFALKNSNGKSIKTSVLRITSTSCTIL